MPGAGRPDGGLGSGPSPSDFCDSLARLWHKAPGLQRTVAAQVFEVVIHMPQYEIAGDSGLRDHEVWQRDGHPLPSHGIPYSGFHLTKLRSGGIKFCKGHATIPGGDL